MDNSPTILETWLHPLSLSEFFTRYWKRELYSATANRDRLKYSQELLPSLDLPVLLEYSKDPISVWYRDGDTPVFSLVLERKEALHAYRAGLTLYFLLDAVISAKVITQLSRDLQRPPDDIKVSIFASRRGGRTLPHVDGNENLTVQLRGVKSWQVSPGQDWPGIQGIHKPDPSTPELLQTLRPPASWSEVSALRMDPGSFLYCPAPYWHTVETIEDSLSLNVTLGTKITWADIVWCTIRAALLRQEAWRTREIGLWSSGDQRKNAGKFLSDLLNRLSADLQNISAEDVLAAWNAAEGPTSFGQLTGKFIRNPFVSCTLVSTTIGNEFEVRVESMVRPGPATFLKFPWKCYSAFLQLMSDPSDQSAEKFKHVPELIGELSRYGVLRSEG